MKKSIKLTEEEVKNILSYINTTICYLEMTKCRFDILNMDFYGSVINDGILDCIVLKEKFTNFLDKFIQYSIDFPEDYIKKLS